jgi:heme A synthase
MLPVKWKLFKIVQVIALAIYIPVVLLDIYGIITKPVENDFLTFFIVSQVIFLLISFIYCGNLLLNLKLLSAAFSKDQQASVSRKLSATALMLFLIVLAGLILFFIALLYTEFISKKDHTSPSRSFYLVLLIYIAALISMGIYTAIMQLKLLRLISNISKRTVNSLIESIGSTEKEG